MNQALPDLGPPRQLVVVAPPGSRRVLALQATLQAHGWPRARVVPYLDLLQGVGRLAEQVHPGELLRLESPGEDPETERAILAHGDVPDEDGAFWRMSGPDLADLDLATGRLPPTRQWYLGYRRLLHDLAGLDLPFMSAPADILTMFDKRATHARLTAAGVPVPEALPPISSAEELLSELAARGWRRAFVKLAHGSSASGAVALELGSAGRVQATTTVEVVSGPEGVRLYNSRRLLRYRTWPEVRTLLDALSTQRLHVERWVPKAGWAGRTLDLRVVVVGGQAAQVLARLGRGPMTNLHLKNERGDWAAVLEQLGEHRWAEIKRNCEAALAAFPGALYGGVDVLLTPDFRRHFILELNAYGDYHRGVLWQGLDTYGAELRAWNAGRRAVGQP